VIREFASVVRTILGLDVARRSLHVFPDDTFIVSYPRSGNTWTRFLVANLLHPGDPVTFENIERVVPDMHAQSKRFFRRLPRPRVIKSHEYFDPRYRRVIYIVRDPRDIVLSAYHFHRKQRQIEDNYPLERYVTRFLAGDVFSVYASWGQNVASWLATRPVGHLATGPGLFGNWGDSVSSWWEAPKNGVDFLLLRYEAMVENPESELARIAAFLGISATPDLLSQTVARSSADAMRKLEQSQAKSWVLTKNTRQDVPFVRAATSGGWKSALPSESVAEMERVWGHLMKAIGYELTSDFLPDSLGHESQREPDIIGL
jgi:estrone sulfotransferase